MAHSVAVHVNVELDDIWLYIAKQSASIVIADTVIDMITDGSTNTLGHNWPSAMKGLTGAPGRVPVAYIARGQP
jgi:hypothetical protein